MTAPHSKPAHRSIRNPDFPLASLTTRAVRHQPALMADATLADRIRGEFLEMRGFSPTLEQAKRLFHLSEDVCRDVLAALVTEGFLHVEHDGRFRLSSHL